MRRYLLRGLLVISTSGTATVHAGGPSLFHHSSRHHACTCVDCGQRPIVIHCCPSGGSESDRRQESGRQTESTISAPLLQSTMPAIGYGGYPQFAMPQMAIMPYPVATQASGYQLPEAQRQRSDCCDSLRRLEDDVRQLSRDVDRIVDVVDRHSRILDRLTEVLSANSEFMKNLDAPKVTPQAANSTGNDRSTARDQRDDDSRVGNAYRLTR